MNTHDLSSQRLVYPSEEQGRKLTLAQIVDTLDEHHSPLHMAILPRLIQISSELLSTHETDRLLDKILYYLRELVPFTSAAIHTIEGDTLHTKAGVGDAATAIGFRQTIRSQDFVWQYIERTGKPYVTGDRAREEWHPLPDFEHIRSFMAVLLRAHDRSIALLTVDHREPNRFGSREVELVTLFANYAAIALHNAQFIAKERTLRRLIELQQEFSYTLMRIANAKEMAEALLDTTAKIVQFDAGSVMLLHPTLPDQGQVVATRGYIDPPSAEFRTINQDAYPLLRILQQKLVPIYLPDVRDDERWQPGEHPDPQEVRSVLLAPLVDTGQAQQMGILTLKSYRPDAFSKDAIEVIALLCNHAAQAVHNLRLFEETQRRLAETEILAEISQRLNRTFELNDLLRFVLEKALSMLEKDSSHSIPLQGAIILRQRPGDQMKIAISHGLSEEDVKYFNTKPYYAHEGTFVRSVLHGEWVELQTPDEVLAAYAGPKEYLANLPQLLNIPLKSEDEVIGVLTANQVVREPSTRRILEAMANFAGAAIHKAQLLERARRQAIELLEAYEALHAMDQRREEFIHSLTHDLRTALTFVQGYADLMLDRALGEITPEQQDALEVMVDRVNHVVCMINQMLEKSTNELPSLSQERVLLDELARKAVRSAQVAAQKAGLTIEMEISGAPLIVYGDSNRLTRVFDNLLSNAIKYSLDGGTIKVSMRREGNQVVTDVSDPGIGIPPEELKRIWQRYYRAEEAIKHSQGNGHGLANVRHIVEAHGGRIQVVSRPGEGTTFTFYLPLHMD